LVVAGFFYRGFQDEGFVAQFGMVHDAAEAFEADVAFADVLMAVEVGAEGSFGVVGVDDVDVFEA
jgi:hypothetical protein